MSEVQALAQVLATHASHGWDGKGHWRCRCGQPFGPPRSSWLNAEPHWTAHVAAALLTSDTQARVIASAKKEALLDAANAAWDHMVEVPRWLRLRATTPPAETDHEPEES